MTIIFDINKMVKVPSTNDKDFVIEIHQWSGKKDEHPFLTIQPQKGDIFISNLVEIAQRAYLINKEYGKTIVAHGGYCTPHRERIFQVIMENFSKGCNPEYILRSGPVIQASMNISTRRMYTDACSPENLLQRIGRVNRFGEHPSAECHVYWAEKYDHSMNMCLSNSYSKFSTNDFIKFLLDKNGNKFTIKINDLYELYHSYNNDPSRLKERKKEEIQPFVQDGVNYLSKSNIDFFKPVDYFGNKNNDDKQKRLSKKSMRGASVYVNPTYTYVSHNNGVSKISYHNVSDNPYGSFLFDPANIQEDSLLLTIGLDDYRMKFRNGDLSKNQEKNTGVFVYNFKDRACDLSHYKTVYNKHNSKYSSIVSRAREPNMAILIGDPGDCNLNLGEHNMTYCYSFDEKNGIPYAVGLISYDDLCAWA